MPSLLTEDHVVESDSVALGIHVHLAHGVSLIARLPEALRQGRQIRVHRKGLVEDAVPMGPRRGSRHEGPASGDAGRGCGVGLREPHPAAAELVERWGEDFLVTRFTYQGPGPVIRADEEHIRLCVRLVQFGILQSC